MSVESLGVLVYGGGVAAAATAIELQAHGLSVTLCGPVPVRCWPGLPEAGINVGGDREALARWTTACGGHDDGVAALAKAAPEIFEQLAQLGVPFARRSDGSPELRQLPGCDAADAAFVESRTRSTLLTTLDNQLRHAKTDAVVRMESHELLSLVADFDGRCAGVVLQDLVSGSIVGARVDAVVLATGGPEKLFDGPGALCTEAGVALAHTCGARIIDPHRIQLHPTALASAGDRLHLLSSAARAESGRVWLAAGDDERDYPLEDEDGFDDACARSIASALLERDEDAAYLDLSHLPAGRISERLGSEIDACVLLTDIDPAKAALPVRPCASGSLGGVWTDESHRSSIEGLYAVGDVQQRYHGRCRLGGNGLLADLYGARVCADAIAGEAVGKTSKLALRSATKKGVEAFDELLKRQGAESIVALHGRLRELMSDQLGPLADQAELSADDAQEQLVSIRADSKRAGCRDGSRQSNRSARDLRDLDSMLQVAELMLRSLQQSEEAVDG